MQCGLHGVYQKTNMKKKIAELLDAIDKLSFMDSQGSGPLVYRAEVKAAIRNVLAKWKIKEKPCPYCRGYIGTIMCKPCNGTGKVKINY